jgi:anti-sigma regulatory factor (Ser/Thr protein kinase)
MAELAERLFEAVDAFSAGAPQEDDMTVVLARRDARPGPRRAFPRTMEAIEPMVAFTADAFAGERIDPALRSPVDLALEELFTNMVKYGRSGALVTVEINRVPRGVEVTLTEDDAERFDPTKGADVDVTAPIEQRQPGGLGLHLVRRLVDSIDYHYAAGSRQGRTTFLKMLPDARKKGET